MIVYGSKANDTVTIDTSLTVPVTLNGGTGGKNTLKAGGGPATEEGWYGQNTLVQGSSQNYQFGQVGHVTFVKGTGTSDVIFIGRPGHFVGSQQGPPPPHAHHRHLLHLQRRRQAGQDHQPVRHPQDDDQADDHDQDGEHLDQGGDHPDQGGDHADGQAPHRQGGREVVTAP